MNGQGLHQSILTGQGKVVRESYDDKNRTLVQEMGLHEDQHTWMELRINCNVNSLRTASFEAVAKSVNKIVFINKLFNS